MGSNHKKKEDELFFLEHFKRVYGKFPSGVIKSLEGDDEPPDFIVKNSQGHLGIEVTMLYREAINGKRPLIEQVSLQKHITKKAKKIYDNTGLPPIRVSIYFDYYNQIRKITLEPLAQFIVDVVVRNFPEENKSYCYNADSIDNNDYPQIHKITITRFSFLAQSEWVAPHAGFMPAINPESIQKTLDKKNEKYDACLKKCQVTWLVIVCNTDIASGMDIPETIRTHSFKSKFQRAFLFSYHDSLRLQPTNNAVSELNIISA